MANLKKFTLEEIAKRTAIVYVIIKRIGKRKTVLRNFPDEDSAFNFYDTYKSNYPRTKIFIKEEVKSICKT